MQSPPERRDAGASGSPLPSDRAFVIHLRPAGDARSDVFVGRIEHIVSGTAGRFASPEDLVEFVKHVLASGDADRSARLEEES